MNAAEHYTEFHGTRAKKFSAFHGGFRRVPRISEASMFIVLFIAILGVLVIAHELGHFFAARKSGVKVEEFGIGIPPRVWGKKIGEVLYSINLLPIGGFVRIFGEEGEHKSDPRSFAAKKPSVRALILTAGVLMNIALAWIVFSIGHIVGMPEALSEKGAVEGAKDVGIQVVEVVEGSPAERAGIKRGDIIARIEAGSEVLERPVFTEEVSTFLANHPGTEVSIRVKRGGGDIVLRATTNETYIEGEGFLGVGLLRIGRVSSPWYEAPFRGIETTISAMGTIARAFAQIVWDFIAGRPFSLDVAGPVGIAVLTKEASQLGVIYLLQFVAWISLHLAFLNILPFPALDGGRLLFVAIEKIKGSPVPKRVEKLVHATGFAILIGFIVFITIRDIGRFL